METYNSQDFADYFNEFRYIDDEDKSEEGSLEDDDKAADDTDTEWLARVGLNPQVLVSEDGNDAEKEEFLEDFCKSLTYRQASIVRKKFRSVKATIRKKKRVPKIRDVRDVFSQTASEAPSSETRSRSETPDSLDSLSSPSPPEWVPEASNGSPTFSQGYHSTDRNSPNSTSSHYSLSTVASVQWKIPSTQHLRRRNASEERLHTPDAQDLHAGIGFQSLPDTKSAAAVSTYDHERRSQSQFYVNAAAAAAEAPFGRGQHQKKDVAVVAGSDDFESGIEILSFQNCGSLHGTRSLSDVLTSHGGEVELSSNDANFDLKDETNQDWGFENGSPECEDDSFQSLHCVPDKRSGVTYLSDLSLEDVRQIQSLVLLELTFIFDQYKLHYLRRKTPKIKRKEVVAVFGVPLTTLVENDRKFVPNCNIPLVLEMILNYLEKFGLREEGILRVPGSVHKIQMLKHEVETNFYTAPSSVNQTLHSCSVNDVTAILKYLLRELPVPLLTNEYMDAFFALDRVPEKSDQLKALKALILLIPEVHRNTLYALLSFLARVVENERYNRMGLHNVAMILAPNLFLPKKLKNDAKKDLASEMKIATSTCHLTKLMIKYHGVLFSVPNFLIQQIRVKNDSLAMQRNIKENSRPKRWLLTRKPKMEIYRKIKNEVDFQNGIIRVHAPQLNVSSLAVHLTPTVTSSDVVDFVLGAARDGSSANDDAHLRERRRSLNRQDSRRVLSELAPNSNLSCLVAATNSESALKSHVLCEVGGNIGKRRLHGSTVVTYVYQSNPNAQWVIECNHLNKPSWKHKTDSYV